jgi:hypothetical protein
MISATSEPTKCAPTSLSVSLATMSFRKPLPSSPEMVARMPLRSGSVGFVTSGFQLREPLPSLPEMVARMPLHNGSTGDEVQGGVYGLVNMARLRDRVTPPDGWISSTAG